MYYLVTTDVDERGCDIFKFGTKDELLNKINSLDDRYNVDLIVEGKEFELKPIEVIKKWSVTEIK